MSVQQNLFINRPKLAIVISLAILLAGILMIKTLPLEEYPSITPPQVVVTATYSGASSDVIESTIAAPVEAQLNGVENMIYMTSTSQSGSYKLTLFFEVGTDADMAVIDVQNELQLVTPRLPEEVKRYGLSVKKSTGGPGLLMISVNSPNNSYNNLFISNYADIFIKDELARIKGIGDVSVFGASTYSMRIWLNAEKMANYNLSTSEVISAIRSQNTQTPAGDLGVEPMQNKQLIKLTMRTKGRLKEVEDFENIIVKSLSNGAQIKLKDIATIELGAENYSNFSRISGKNSAIITVSQQPDANAINLSNKVRQKMAELSKSFPKDLEYKIQHDETEFVRESIKEVVSAVVLAVLLVSLVTYLFLGSVRAAFIPFAAIPVSLIGVFVFMKLLGFSINLLILFGLVLAVGLVVDDAIVVLENAQRHIQEGKDPKTATEITMKEVFGAVLATSLVLMAVFVPVSFMGGITGQMFRQFALCISASIGLSTMVALTLAPALCAVVLKSGEEKADFKFIKNFNEWFNKIRDKYLKYVIYFVNSWKLTILSLFLISSLTLLLFWLIPKGFLPQEDRGAVFTQIQLPDGSSASRTDEVAKDVENKLMQIAGIKDTISLVGMSGKNTAFIVSDFKPWAQRKNSKESLNGIMKAINKEFYNYPKATVATFSPPAISGLGMFGGFEYQLLDKGDRDTAGLYSEAQKLIKKAMENSDLAMIYTSYSPNLPQLLLEVDIDKAMAQNVEITEIYDTIASYFAKSYVNDFNKYGRVYRVYVQADAPFREKISDLNKIYVKNNYGKMVPLSAVIKIKNIVGPSSRTRFNMYPAITINGSARQGISSGQAMKTMEKISNEILPKDMGFAWSGTSLQEQQSEGQIGPILAMSIVFIFLFLVGLYESWLLPISVLLVSPIALVGALLFQYVAGFDLDIYAQIGLVMLIGLSTKQAILIIEFAKGAHLNDGLTIKEAAMQAAKLRFRAVMMTNIAFLLGLLPLVFATGAGAGSRHSVGMTVFGGMSTVAFLGTFLVPAFYVMIEEFKINFAQKVRQFREQKMFKNILYCIILFSIISSPAIAKGSGNPINTNEFPKSEKVLPNEKNSSKLIISGSVEKNIDMTLDNCIRLALGNNPKINAAFQNILAADARIKQVWSNYFPSISWQTGYTRLRQLQLSDALGETLEFNYYLLGQASLQQMLYDFGVTQNQATIRKLDYEGYKKSFEATVNDVIYQTKDAYYNVLYAYESRKVAQDTVDKYKLFYEQARALYSTGLNPKVDVTIAETNLSNAKLNLIQAENAVNLALAKLNHVMGIPYIERYDINDKLQYKPVNLSFEQAINIARDSRPELKQAEIRVEAAHQTINLTKKSFLPTISIEGQYQRGGKTWTSNYGFNLGGYLTFPTINGMLIRNEIKEAKYLYDRELANAREMQNEIYLEIQNAYLTLEEKRNQLPVAILQVKQSKENYELSYGRYRVGEASPTELKDAENTYEKAQLTYYSSLYQYNSAKAQLEKAIGKNISNNEECIDLFND